MSDYNIDNAKNDIENLQDQNSYDFQEIKRLDNKLNTLIEEINQNNKLDRLTFKRLEDKIIKLSLGDTSNDSDSSINLDKILVDIKEIQNKIKDLENSSVGGVIDKIGLSNLDSTLYAFIQSISSATSTEDPTPDITDNPPSISNINNITAEINTTFTITYSATDDNGISKHEFSDDNGDSWVTVYPTKSGNNFILDRQYSSEILKTCRIRVTDSNNQITTSNVFTITITNIDTPVDNSPTIGIIESYSSKVNEIITIEYNITDDGDITKHEFSDNNGESWSTIIPSVNNGNYSFTKSYDSVKVLNCLIRVTDNGGNISTSNLFVIEVEADSQGGGDTPPTTDTNIITVTDIVANTGTTLTQLDNNTFTIHTKSNTYQNVPLLKNRGENILSLDFSLDCGTSQWYSFWILVGRTGDNSIVLQVDQGGNIKFFNFGVLTNQKPLLQISLNFNMTISSDGIVSLTDFANNKTQTFDLATFNPNVNEYGLGITTTGSDGLATLTIPPSTFNLRNRFSLRSIEIISNEPTPCDYNIPNKIEELEEKLDNIPNKIEELEEKLDNIIITGGSGSSNGGDSTGTTNTLPTTRLYTFRDAYINWINGEKFPVAIYGDSTTDGDGTTNEVLNEAGEDTISPNAYPEVLQSILRTETRNNVLRIYNAGYRTRAINFGIGNYNKIFKTGPFKDAKLIGIRFGINDSGDLGANLYQARASFKASVKQLIEKIKADGKQPFLMTTQPFIGSKATWKFKDSYGVDIFANEVYRELAIEYNLEIMDIHEKLEDFLIYSKYLGKEVTDGGFHFKDVGHKYTAGLMFKYFSNRVINVGCEPVRVDYFSQKLGTDILQDGTFPTPVASVDLTYFTSVDDQGFKSKYKKTKTDSSDLKILDCYVFNDSKSQKQLLAYCDVYGKQYVTVNGIKYNMTDSESEICSLDLGLHHIQVFTGETTAIDFRGLIIK